MTKATKNVESKKVVSTSNLEAKLLGETNLELDKINDFLNSKEIKNKLSKSKVKEVSNNIKSDMFKYPIEWDKLSKEDKSKKSKSFRTSARKKRNQFSNNVILFAKSKRIDELKKEIKNFNIFYKKTYSLNDYSLLSFCRKNSDDDTKENLNLFLSIVKQLK